jgi:hypothetical protein
MTSVAKYAKDYSTFDPRYISGCTLWLDGDDSSTITFSSGSSVGTWRDKSTSGNNATGGTNKPIYPQTLSNGRKALLFTSPGIMTLDVTKLPTGTSSFSMFIVSQITSDSGSDNVVLSWGTTTTNSTSYRFFYSRLFTNVFRPGISTNTSSVPQSYNTTNTYNALNLISNQVTSSADLPYVNGTAFGVIGSRSAYNIGTTNATIGALNTGSLVNYFSGYLGEIIIFNRSITNTERQQVEGYLAWKWGLQGNLPSGGGHPYNTTVNRGPFLSTFTPTDFSNCVLWFDAADNTKITGTTSVTAWANKGSASTTAINAIGTVSSGNTYNGLNYLAFPSGSQLNFTANLVSTTSRSWIAVYRLKTSLASPYSIINQTDTPISGQDIINGTYSAPSTHSMNMNATNLTVQLTTSTLSNPFNVVNIGSFINSTTVASNAIVINGTSQTLGTSLAAAGYAANSSATYTISRGGYNTAMDMFEIIFYSRDLSVVERQTVEGYLAWKWGTSSSLPSTHPFKNFYPLKVN